MLCETSARHILLQKFHGTHMKNNQYALSHLYTLFFFSKISSQEIDVVLKKIKILYKMNVFQPVSRTPVLSHHCTNRATYTVPATVCTYPTQEVPQFLKPDEQHTEHLQHCHCEKQPGKHFLNGHTPHMPKPSCGYSSAYL